ncbi:hypothetical protein FBU31_002413 [Coemansia sp. 'formosensis']|nr:hypothetical protein FBU31_002413 [Coemansia sp. 'formosensis']
MSARDLLRRAREQKKQQQKVASSADTNTSQLAGLSSDARLDKGNLFCRICNVQVRPADISSWKIHVASRRHQQSKPAKRPHEPDGISDISKLSIEPEAGETAKRQKLEDEEAQQPTVLVGYDSDESEEAEDTAESKPDDGDASGLPAGFFDDGVEPAAHNEGDGEQAALPSGFFDNPDDEKAALASAVAEPDTTLDERLAEFESEIANLAEPTAAPPDAEEDDAEPSEETELEHQSEMWRQRTDKLIHLRSIIKEGIRDMDQGEQEPRAEDMSEDTGDSDSEYAELMDWRSGNV